MYEYWQEALTLSRERNRESVTHSFVFFFIKNVHEIYVINRILYIPRVMHTFHSET